jgi:hypothetical protein
VGSINTSVNDVSASTRTGSVIVGVGSATGRLRRDTGETPRGVGLGGRDGDDRILLDVLNGGVVTKSGQLLLGKAGGETVETVGIGVVGISLDRGDGTVDGSSDNVLLELDDVLAIDQAGAAGDDERSGRITLGLDAGGSGHGQGEESEKSGRTHLDDVFGVVCWVLVRKEEERMMQRMLMRIRREIRKTADGHLLFILRRSSHELSDISLSKLAVAILSADQGSVGGGGSVFTIQLELLAAHSAGVVQTVTY